MFPIKDEESLENLLFGDSDISLFYELLKKSKFDFGDYEQLTVLAPDNNSLEQYLRLKDLTLSSISQEEASILISSHILPVNASLVNFVKGLNLLTIDGSLITIDQDKEGITLGGARIREGDIKAISGTLHKLNKTISK